MRKRDVLLTVALSLAALPLCAAYEEVTAARFPDADSVVVDGLEDIAYNPDGTEVCESAQTIKVLTEKGRREEGEIEMRYSARYGRAAILSVSVTGADGAVREVDVAATTKESTDNSSASANIYDPMHRKIVCTVPGLRVGDCLTYRTRRETFASRIKDQWSELSVLEWSCPMLRQVVRITSPAGRPLKRIALRHSLGNVTYAEEKRENGDIVRTWTVKDSPQMFPEPDMPPQYTQVQNLRASTAADWREISRWYWDVSLPHLERTTEAISNKVFEIAAELGVGADAAGEAERLTPDDRLLTGIYKWVAQEVRYMGLTMEDTSPGYAPHDVDITFENRYGVCRDKAALLVAMLRIAGFEAYPVLIHAGAKMDPEVPQPYFNHAIACVAASSLRDESQLGVGREQLAVGADAEEGAERPAPNAKYILMDPTDESSRDLLPAYLSDRSYLVARPDGEDLLTSPVPPASANAVRVASEGTLNRDGSLLLESTVDFTGINDNVYRQVLLRRKKDARRKMFERILVSLAPGAELLDLDIAPANLQDTSVPLRARLTARIPETLLEGETRTEFAPPLLSRVFGAANWLLEGKTALETRRYPLVIDSTAMVDETLTVKLNGVVGRPLKLPAEKAVRGNYEYVRRVACDGDDALTVTRRVAVNTVEMDPAAYLEVRERIKEMEAAEREKPVFANRRFAGANARVRLQREVVNTASADSWTSTNTVVRQILSYDGKKKYAELTREFFPTWMNYEVVSAVVSNRDGRVSVLTPREVNVFDCEWAAAAPRYPASKRLVANLPGVEIGSVITYTTVTSATNAPAGFRGTWYFDAAEPADEIALVLNGEAFTQRDAKVIPSEPMTADGELWRNCLTVTSNDFHVAARALRRAADVRAYREKDAPWGRDVKSIRDWMAKNVRVAGPSLYEVPFDRQITDTATILAERYAARLDYVRTLCALLKGAGHDADIVFAAYDANQPAPLALRAMTTAPDVGAFSLPLVRVRERVGGFLWWGGRTLTTYLGTENEYAPLGATAYDGCHFFDPEEEAFGVVRARTPDLEAFDQTELTLYVRENGAVDFDIASTKWGPGVAAFRKKYAEMLPEDRQRHYQSLLGDIAQAATATRELETDVEGYPATMRFSAYVPDFATVADDVLTVALPTFLEQLFPLTGAKRENPIGVGAAAPERSVVRIVFPEGYTAVEHLPDAFRLHDPTDGTLWCENAVETAYDYKEGDDGLRKRLVVTITRTSPKRPYAFLSADYAALLRDWSRLASSRANRTLSVRRAP